MVTSVFVVFIITVEFLVSAVYTGGVPLVEHSDSLKPGNVRATGYRNVTLGLTSKKEIPYLLSS